MKSVDNRPLKVFLCHAHPDADKVRALYARLKADGVDAWLDKENIIPGQDWEMEIRDAVRESDIVVVCLSKQFSQKGYRQKEVRIVLDEASKQPPGEIFIIPARLEECDYPESLKHLHGVDLFEERGYEYLMRALRLRADKIGAVLQSKKGWLGGLTSPTKKPDTQKPKPVVKPLPKPKPEEPKPVITQRPPRKWNTQMIAAIAGVVVIFAAIFGLPWRQWLSSSPTTTSTVTSIIETSTATKIPTAIATVTSIVPTTFTSTITPTVPTLTFTFTPDPWLTSGKINNSEGGGANLRQSPNGKYLMTLDNGTIVEIYPDFKQVNGIAWLRVAFNRDGRRVEGWLLESVVSYSTPVPNFEPLATSTTGITPAP
ncbi:hypothetical protein ANAEL_03002 [Anaerolineales bacterium]|nr:hypothetical protein ANAEL_03002 [Anaerolineales bacterium]